MVNQYNNGGWVALVLISMAICLILGLVLGMDAFGPAKDVLVSREATKGAIDARAAEADLAATQTPQAEYVKSTAVAANMTAQPIYQTATKMSEDIAEQSMRSTATRSAQIRQEQIEQAAAQATLTAISNRSTLDARLSDATAVAIAQAAEDKPDWTGAMLVVLAGAGAFWIVTRTWVQVSNARSHAKVAKAHLEQAEFRRLKAETAAIRYQVKPSNRSENRKG
jgi:hypothetical protein